MNQGISLTVYPVKDIEQAKKLYTTFFGVEPYIASEYYVGYKLGDHEVGLDPNGPAGGPITYHDVTDIRKSLQDLLDAGAELQRDVEDVANGLLVATVKDASGNLLGLRQDS